MNLPTKPIKKMQLNKIEYVNGIFGKWGNSVEAERPMILPVASGTQTAIGEVIPAALIADEDLEWSVGELNDWTEQIKSIRDINSEFGQRVWIAGITEIFNRFTA